LIHSINTTQARQAPGVIAVFTAEDMADVAPIFATSRMKDYHATAILGLAKGKVRFAGEPVVGVVAQSRYLAEDAAELIEIEFEPLPLVIDPEEALKPDTALLHEDAGTNVLLAREFKRGDVDKVIAAAPL
jgi:carbon-monoxide dehydrogenase large subunit